MQLVDPPRESARVNPHHLVVRPWETLEFDGEVRPALAARQQKGHEQHDEPHRARDFVVVWARDREVREAVKHDPRHAPPLFGADPFGRRHFFLPCTLPEKKKEVGTQEAKAKSPSKKPF